LLPGTIPYTGGGTDTAAVRLAGYAVAMRAAGLEPHTIEGGFRSEAAHEAVRRLLDQSALSAALLVSNKLDDARRAQGGPRSWPTNARR
jgi:DNA-binding LacI/PurR family transcriptional regulator